MDRNALQHEVRLLAHLEVRVTSRVAVLGKPRTLDKDIVFANGQFIQYPGFVH
jgi:hypothetical protein